MATKKKSSKGKRYTAEEKQEVIDFVIQHNAENGRGGATNASKKFGVSQLTIGSWLKASGQGKAAKPGKAKKTAKASKTAKAPRTPGRKAASAGKRGDVLSELSKLDGAISAKRQELEKLEARFQDLKAGL